MFGSYIGIFLRKFFSRYTIPKAHCSYPEAADVIPLVHGIILQQSFQFYQISFQIAKLQFSQ